MSSQVLRSRSDWHLRFIDLYSHLAPFRKRIQVCSTLDQTLSKFLSTCLERVSTDGEWTLGLVGLEELHQLCRVEKVEEMIDQLIIVAIVPVKQASQLLNIMFSWFALAQSADVHENVNGLLDLKIDHADIDGFVIGFALVLKRRSIAIHVFVAFLRVLDVIVVFLCSFLELFVDLLIILLTVLLFQSSFFILCVLCIELVLFDLSFFLRLFLLNLFLFNFLRFLRRHFLFPLLAILSLFLLLELVLNLDLRLFFLLTLHLLLKSQSSKSILALCSLSFIHNLEELLATWLHSQRCFSYLAGPISNLLMFCRLGTRLCLAVSIELAHLQ